MDTTELEIENLVFKIMREVLSVEHRCAECGEVVDKISKRHIRDTIVGVETIVEAYMDRRKHFEGEVDRQTMLQEGDTFTNNPEYGGDE